MIRLARSCSVTAFNRCLHSCNLRARAGRILVGDLLDDADHDLFRKVCHSHHSLNHLLPPKRIFTNLRARAGHPF